MPLPPFQIAERDGGWGIEMVVHSNTSIYPALPPPSQRFPDKKGRGTKVIDTREPHLEWTTELLTQGPIGYASTLLCS